MFLPSGKGGKKQPPNAKWEPRAGSALLLPGSPGRAPPGVTRGLGHSCCTSCCRSAHKGFFFSFFLPLIHAGAYSGGADCALPASPPSCLAALQLLQGFSAGSAEKGLLRRQMKGKCWWEQEGQWLFLHAYEGKQMNPVSCTAAAPSRPCQPC